MKKYVLFLLIAPIYLVFFGGGGGYGEIRSRNSPKRRQTGKTPRNNQNQNKQFNDAVSQLRREGIYLNRDMINQLHRAISGLGLGFWEIVEFGRAMFGRD